MNFLAFGSRLAPRWSRQLDAVTRSDHGGYAERIFTDPKALVALACEHALVRTKLLFVLQTYVTLDARMERVFRELGVDGAHLCERR